MSFNFLLYLVLSSPLLCPPHCQILLINNDDDEGTTGVVIPAKSVALFAFDGDNWAPITSTKFDSRAVRLSSSLSLFLSIFLSVSLRMCACVSVCVNVLVLCK